MSFANRIAIAVLSAAALAGISYAASAQTKPTAFRINDVTCRDLLKMDGDEKDFTIVYFHGFHSGSNKIETFDAEALGAATDKVMDHCIDDPKSNLRSVFEKSRS
jgi:hypothetical protein